MHVQAHPPSPSRQNLPVLLTANSPALPARPQDIYAPIFHSVSVPSISPSTYLESYLTCDGLRGKEHMSEQTVLVALLLLDRLVVAHSSRGMHLCSSNVHRVLLTAMMLAAKLLDDEAYCSEYWSRVGGVSLSHLNELEVAFLQLIDHRLFVTPEELDAVRASLYLR